MIFRNVSICRSCKNCNVIKILFWTKLIQMISDKIPNWMWIILQFLYLQKLTKSLKFIIISDWIWYFCVMLITIWCINVKSIIACTLLHCQTVNRVTRKNVPWRFCCKNYLGSRISMLQAVFMIISSGLI